MIFVECNADFTLVKSLTNIPKRQIIHELQGKGGVCNQLKKRTNCKGLVDEDPTSAQPSYIKQPSQTSDLPEHGLKVLHDNANNNRIIVLCPRLEEWVLKAAAEAGVDVRKYKLPNDGARLRRLIRINLGKFEDLLKDLSDSVRLKTLRSILEEKI